MQAPCVQILMTFCLRILCQVLVYEEMGCHVGCDGVVGSVKLFSKRPAGELSASDVVGALK